jgi:hypothetical protein
LPHLTDHPLSLLYSRAAERVRTSICSTCFCAVWVSRWACISSGSRSNTQMKIAGRRSTSNAELRGVDLPIELKIEQQLQIALVLSECTLELCLNTFKRTSQITMEWRVCNEAAKFVYGQSCSWFECPRRRLINRATLRRRGCRFGKRKA